jgi:lysophospholipase L1-like esterase
MSRPEQDTGRSSPTPTRSPYGRRLMPAGRVLVVILVTLLTWTFMYAPTLRRGAEASPIGVRRTVSLAVLTPIAAVSNFVALDELAEAVDRAVGRDPDRAGGAFVPPPEDIPVAPDGGQNEGGPGDGDGGGKDGPAPAGQPIRRPTPTKKLRVVVIGDSLAAGLGYFAERVFRPKLVRVSRQGRISTGLARPDYFNWPFTLRRIVHAFDPDLVIVMLGENDHQSLVTVRGTGEAVIGTSGWPPAYRQRVLLMMQIATSHGAKVVWVGLPISSDRALWEHSRIQNDVFRYASSITPGVAYFDAWERFRDPHDGYTAYLREGGTVELVRAGDGLHFNALGYTIIAREIAQLAAEEFGLSGRTFETEI